MSSLFSWARMAMTAVASCPKWSQWHALPALCRHQWPAVWPLASCTAINHVRDIDEVASIFPADVPEEQVSGGAQHPPSQRVAPEHEKGVGPSGVAPWEGAIRRDKMLPGYPSQDLR
jgi:hypothetical protein